MISEHKLNNKKFKNLLDFAVNYHLKATKDSASRTNQNKKSFGREYYV